MKRKPKIDLSVPDPRQLSMINPPSSPTARSFGCSCDPRINRSGDGAGTNGSGVTLFVTDKHCPFHGDKSA